MWNPRILEIGIEVKYKFMELLTLNNIDRLIKTSHQI